MENIILLSIISTTGLGIFFATILALANKTLKVEEDSRVKAAEEALPGLNCGACGYAGCQAFAIAIVKGKAPVNGCLAGGAETTEELAWLLGRKKKETIRKTAILHCNANENERTKDADYNGIKTCKAANLLKGVIKCSNGCLGYGDCSDICPFSAITMVKGLPIVNYTKCTACGKCVEICPRVLFSIEIHEKALIYVACSSRDKSQAVKKACSKGCIACGICQKLSDGVFKMENNLAGVDYNIAKTKSVEWDKIMSKCPTKVIVKK